MNIKPTVPINKVEKNTTIKACSLNLGSTMTFYPFNRKLRNEQKNDTKDDFINRELNSEKGPSKI
jgi:hypothetical protein